MDLLSIRALLFTPANRPERFENAKSSGADGVVLDLEDAISLKEKDEARNIVIQYFKSLSPEKIFLHCLRINSIKTPMGLKDISAIIDNRILPDILMIPKVESAEEIAILDLLFKPQSITYIALIETPKGLNNLENIVYASVNLQGICFGAADFAADLGVMPEWEAMLVAREKIVCAAAMVGLAALDAPYFKLDDVDDAGIREETRRIKALGYTGKLAIHPKQIKPILEIFTPSREEIKQAQRIVDAFEKAEANVCEVDGKMIDIPSVRLARRILALASR